MSERRREGRKEGGRREGFMTMNHDDDDGDDEGDDDGDYDDDDDDDDDHDDDDDDGGGGGGGDDNDVEDDDDDDDDDDDNDDDSCPGHPEPEVDWFKDNKMLHEGARYQFKFEDDGLCMLVIREATASDRGRYKCVASNPAGKVQCSAQLFVESELAAMFGARLALRLYFGPFTPKSDQFQIFPAASPEILHNTV